MSRRSSSPIGAPWVQKHCDPPGGILRLRTQTHLPDGNPLLDWGCAVGTWDACWRWLRQSGAERKTTVAWAALTASNASDMEPSMEPLGLLVCLAKRLTDLQIPDASRQQRVAADLAPADAACAKDDSAGSPSVVGSKGSPAGAEKAGKRHRSIFAAAAPA